MKQDTVKTRVIFRKFPEGDIIALFPDEINYPDGRIESYMHIGQHSGASPDLIHELTPATPEESQPLKQELESIGYLFD